MSAHDLDPRRSLIDLCAAVIQVVGGAAYAAEPASILADDGLTPAGQSLVAEGQAALASIASLAAFFGCAVQAPDARTIPDNPALPAHVRYVLLRIIEAP